MSSKPLMEGCEVERGEGGGGHIKGINQHHNFGSTWTIFHLSHIAEHLVCNTLILCHLLLLYRGQDEGASPRHFQSCE